MKLKCPNCGHEEKSENAPEDLEKMKKEAWTVLCPNCDTIFPIEKLEEETP